LTLVSLCRNQYIIGKSMKYCIIYRRILVTVLCIVAVVLKVVLRPYSKSSLTLNEWKFSLSDWASLECHCCFWIAGGLVSYRYYVTIYSHSRQLLKNSADTQEKLRLNLHSCIEYECEWAFRIRVLVQFSVIMILYIKSSLL
jgi:lysylphosphatidylglycerol synthetase-like protein (DUF2156 family)